MVEQVFYTLKEFMYGIKRKLYQQFIVFSFVFLTVMHTCVSEILSCCGSSFFLCNPFDFETVSRTVYSMCFFLCNNKMKIVFTF